MQLLTMTSTVPASAVGNAFVNQYYNVLHQSPQVVHRFYTEASRLSRTGPSGILETVEGQASIHEKIMSLDYGDIGAEIKSIDSQESLGGSVLVVVTGAFLTQTRTKRNFVQTFFLAPQERGGYFVLNDICRHLDEDLETVQAISSMTPLSNGVFEQVSTASLSLNHEHETIEHEEPIREEHSHEDHHYDLPDQVETTEIQDLVVEVPATSHEMAAPASSEHVASPKEQAAIQEPKKSYASILRFAKEPSAIPPVTSQTKLSAPHVERSASHPSQVERSAPHVERSAPSGSVTDQSDEGQHLEEASCDGRSIYVKNLSATITTIELEEEFRKFGRIKLDGISIRTPKPGVCFAFIDFEEVSSAQSAIEASPLSLSGRQAYVEERRSIVSRPGRGRGRGYMNEAARGRGNFGGRGSARGSTQEGDRGRMGRGGYGGGYSRR